MKSNKKNRFFVDSNVIIGDTCYRYNIIKSSKQYFTKALNGLYSKSDVDLYIADFTLANYISKFQGKLNDNDLISEINKLLSKFNLVSMNQKDVENAIANFKNKKRTKDLEDQIQFELSQKVNCSFIITENTTDFSGFGNNYSVHPQKCALLCYFGMKK